jgi:hypothetical protein
MRYLVSQVETWGAEIDAMPAPDPGGRKVGKKEALVMLARQLQTAVRRGYSTTALHAALSEMGLHVHVDTLRAALRAAGRSSAKRPARTGRPEAVAPPPLDRPNAHLASASRAGQSTAPATNADSPRSESQRPARPAPIERPQFAPRDDSDDL